MITKSINTLCYFLFFCLQALGQNSIIYTGRVIDKESQDAIPYATLSWGDPTFNMLADAQGRFRLAYQQSSATELKVSAIGYETQIFDLSIDKIDLKIELNPVSYQLPEQEIVIAEQILKKTFANTDYLLETPFTLEMMLQGDWQIPNVKNAYKIQALTYFHYYKGGDSWLGQIQEKRNLSASDSEIRFFGNWVQTGLYTFDRRTSPCKLKKQKCWDSKMKTEFVKTDFFDGKKVYIISLKMENTEQKFTEGSPFGASAYHAEYVIDASSFRILRQESIIYPDKNHNSPVYTGLKGIEMIPHKFTAIRNYRDYQGKYYLASLKTICTYKALTGESQGKVSFSELEHELITIGLQLGPDYAKPDFSGNLYPLFDFDIVPENSAFWEEYDQKRK